MDQQPEQVGRISARRPFAAAALTCRKAGGGANRRRLFRLRSLRGQPSRWLQDGQVAGLLSLRHPPAKARPLGIGVGHETIGVDRARFGLLAACGDRRVPADAADRTAGAWAERVQVIYLSQSRSVVRKTVQGLGSASRKEPRFRLGAGNRHRSGHRRRRHDQRQGQAGLAGARLGQLRPEDHLQRLCRRDARRPAERPRPSRNPLRRSFRRRLVERPARRARASISTPTATATRACSRQACRMAMGACSPAPARYSKASSATA